MGAARTVRGRTTTRAAARPAALLLLAAAAACVAGAPARAGTLCGTVRDAATSLPVAGAGVFLRYPGGAYTGLYGASTRNGSFCIDQIPPNVYDLEIRVDNFQVQYVRRVVVTGAVTEVPVSIATWPLLLARPSPNPADRNVRFSWSLPAPGPVRLDVFDARGRLVSAWSGDAAAAGAHSLAWDLRDLRGTRVPAGVYFVRLQAAASRRVRSFICLP